MFRNVRHELGLKHMHVVAYCTAAQSNAATNSHNYSALHLLLRGVVLLNLSCNISDATHSVCVDDPWHPWHIMVECPSWHPCLILFVCPHWHPCVVVAVCSSWHPCLSWLYAHPDTHVLSWLYAHPDTHVFSWLYAHPDTHVLSWLYAHSDRLTPMCCRGCICSSWHPCLSWLYVHSDRLTSMFYRGCKSTLTPMSFLRSCLLDCKHVFPNHSWATSHHLYKAPRLVTAPIKVE